MFFTVFFCATVGHGRFKSVVVRLMFSICELNLKTITVSGVDRFVSVNLWSIFFSCFHLLLVHLDIKIFFNGNPYGSNNYGITLNSFVAS